MKHASGPRAAGTGGFTLIELLVVMGIIGLLVGLLVPAVNFAITTARVSSTRNTISALSAGLYAFKRDWGMFPPSSNKAGRPGSDGTYTKVNGFENLALYLVGPQGNGWGLPNNRGAPFGGLASEKLGPYFEQEKGADIHSVRDNFPSLPPPRDSPPYGSILYFRYEPTGTAPGVLQPSTTGITGLLDYSDNPSGASTDTTKGFASEQQFLASVTYTMLGATGGTRPVRWRSEDFVLISAGPDRLFGYVSSGDPPQAASVYNEVSGFYCDDVTSFSK